MKQLRIRCRVCGTAKRFAGEGITDVIIAIDAAGWDELDELCDKHVKERNAHEEANPIGSWE